MALFRDHDQIECEEDARLLRDCLAIVAEESDRFGLAATDDEIRFAALALRKDHALGLIQTREAGRSLVPATIEMLRRIGLRHPEDRDAPPDIDEQRAKWIATQLKAFLAEGEIPRLEDGSPDMEAATGLAGWLKLACEAYESRAAFQNVQLSLSLGEACPAAWVRQAWRQVMTHYGVLRSSFFKVPTGDFHYREHEGVEASWQLLDWTNASAEDVPRHWLALLEEDAARTFDLAKPPLIRFVAIELPAGYCHLLMTSPKVLLDEDALFRLLSAWLAALEGAAA